MTLLNPFLCLDQLLLNIFYLARVHLEFQTAKLILTLVVNRLILILHFVQQTDAVINLLHLLVPNLDSRPKRLRLLLYITPFHLAKK